MSKKIKIITSAKQALREHHKLDSYWSSESRLTQLTVIYIAELLEKILAELKPRRGQSLYNKHVARVIRAGGTMAEAAEEWREIKENEIESQK